MAVYRRSARPRLLLVLLVATSAILVTADIRGSGGGWVGTIRSTAQDAFSPVQSGVSDVVSPVTDFFHGVFQYHSLEAQNALLRQQLTQHQADQVAAADAQREQQDLLDLLKLNFVGDIPTVAARVVAGPASNFQATMVIDRGSGDGLLKGMPVVAGSGLVGRLEQVSSHQSTVLLLTDPSFEIGVRLSPSGDVGVATGQGPGKPLSVDLVDPTTKLATGTVVVSSGLQGSPYPPSIPVGTVRTALAPPGAVRQQVTLDPVVNTGPLAFVKVMVWSPR
ncbi:MAG TPA: rod shape-determining protein MreC [Acidimicrobiales bacterium]|nr:rod shape-determining protein MreC [Acidimicrobiales bacterium]